MKNKILIIGLALCTSLSALPRAEQELAAREAAYWEQHKEELKRLSDKRKTVAAEIAWRDNELIDLTKKQIKKADKKTVKVRILPNFGFQSWREKRQKESNDKVREAYAKKLAADSHTHDPYDDGYSYHGYAPDYDKVEKSRFMQLHEGILQAGKTDDNLVRQERMLREHSPMGRRYARPTKAQHNAATAIQKITRGHQARTLQRDKQTKKLTDEQAKLTGYLADAKKPHYKKTTWGKKQVPVSERTIQRAARATARLPKLEKQIKQAQENEKVYDKHRKKYAAQSKKSKKLPASLQPTAHSSQPTWYTTKPGMIALGGGASVLTLAGVAVGLAEQYQHWRDDEINDLGWPKRWLIKLARSLGVYRHEGDTGLPAGLN